MSSLPECLFVRSPQVKLKTVGEATAVYIPEQQAIHVLNPTAQLLFELLAEPISSTELADALACATDGNPRTIASDVAETLDDFVEKGLVVEARP